MFLTNLVATPADGDGLFLAELACGTLEELIPG
jgi:hypothetical protein